MTETQTVDVNLITLMCILSQPGAESFKDFIIVTIYSDEVSDKVKSWKVSDK